MATATFRAAGHIYERDGIVLPSVTQVLTLSGIDDVSQIPLHYLERAAAIGTAVHEACEFLDQGDLDLDSVHPLIVGYVLGYQKFKEETGFMPLIVEKRGISTSADGTLSYGFCLDRIGILDDQQVLIDIKTSSKCSAGWAIQTAAYAEAMNLNDPRMVVHVAKGGTYKVIRHEGAADFAVWRAALVVAHWKLAYGNKLPR